ncbi:MAG: hypothetical protein ABIH42_05825 [Planctomycetota bacterium]
MVFWKRTFPLAIAFCAGVIFTIQYYVPHPKSEAMLTQSNNWIMIISAFSIVLGLSSLLHIHAGRIKRSTPGWGFSAVLVFSLVTTALLGFIFGREKGSPFIWVYDNMLTPLSSTMFSILAFFIASAAYKAFRARTLEATILLISAVFVMLANVPIGKLISEYIPKIGNWIYENPNMAAQRGILLGLSLSFVATSLKIIFGIERAYLGGGE